MRRSAATRTARGHALSTLRRATTLVVAGASLATFTSSFAAPIVTAGGTSSPPAGSAQVSYLQPLAGPSQAPMYPSGLIWDPTFPTSSGPIPAVVVADTGYNRVTVFDPTQCPVPDTSTCAPIETFGSYGTANGQFNTDRDVAVDASSNIYVADAANNRIEAFTAAGTWLWTAGDTADCNKIAACLVNTPIGISYDPTTNELLVADTGHSEIKAYAAVGGAYGFTAGQYIWESPAGVVKSPREARRGPDGEIWVADYNDEEIRAFQCTCTSTSKVGTAWVTTANKVIGDGAKAGHANGEVNSPYNIAFSPNGQIGYVADTGNERIGVYNVTSCTGTLNGQANECAFIAEYGSRCPATCPAPPLNAANFNALRRVTVDPATGNIWAADFWGSGIHEFSPSGSTSGMYEIDGSPAPASGFSEAYGVAIGPDGTTYVADRLNQRIEEFSSNGTYVTEEGSRGVAAGEYSWPEAVAVTPDKTVWVGDTRNGRLEHFSNANLTGTPTIVGSKGSAVGQFNYIEGVSSAANGVLWVADTDNNRVQSYNPSSLAFTAFGTKGSTPNTNQLLNPESVVASATDVYIADTGNNRVVELDMSGNYVASYTGLDAPQGVALAPDGSIWVANTGVSLTDTNGNDVVHLSSSLTQLGGGFGGPGTGNLQFAEPHSLAVSPNGTTLFVADTYNNRVQEYSIATQLAFTSEPSNADPGVTLSTQPAVTVENALGNTVTTDTGSVTIALTGGPPSANLTCTSGLTVAEVNGVANFSGCSVDTAGTYTLTASDGSLPWSASESFTVGSIGSPAQLAFTPSPGGAALGAPLSPQPVVSVEDSVGNVVPTDTSDVTIALAGTDPGTLTCTNSIDGTADATVQAVNGVATFAGCSVSAVGSGDTLTATDSNSLLPMVTSGSFNITTPIGPPAQLAFTTNPGGATVNAALSPQPVVAVEDSGNNVVTGDSSDVTIALDGPGTLACTNAGGTTVQAVNGVATFSGCSVNTVGTSDTLTASDTDNSVVLTPAVSNGFAITPPTTFSLNPVYQAQISNPNGAASIYPDGGVEDANGNVYFADSGNSQIMELTNTGTLQVLVSSSFGLTNPRGIALDPSGNDIWVPDTQNNRLVEFTLGGTWVQTVGSGSKSGGSLSSPYGLVLGGASPTIAYVANTYGYDVVALNTTTGKAVWTTTTASPVSSANGCDGKALTRIRGIGWGPGGTDLYATDTDNNRIIELDPATGNCLRVFGKSGTGNGAFKAPRDVIADPSGNGLWVADSGNYRIEHVSTTGTFIGATSGGRGTGAGQFVSALSLFAYNGMIAVTDTYNYDVDLFTISSSGKPVYQSPMLVSGVPPATGGFNGAWSVAYDQNGNLYASDYFNDRVEKFDQNGNFVCQFGAYGIVPGTFEFPRGIAVSPDGSTIAVVQEANTVQLFNSNCTFKSQITVTGGLHRPRQVFYDPSNDGSLWIADYGNNRVVHVSSTGTVLLTITDGGAMKSPQGVVVDSSGNVYVADSGNNAIEEYSSTGTLLATLATKGSGPGQVSIPSELALVGPAGQQILLVADQGNNRIIGIPIGTAPALTFGSIGAGPGQLNAPESIAYNPQNGAIAVADFGNSRVSLWGPTSQEVFSPSPIAPTSSLSPGATVTVTVTAETGNGTPTPGVSVWLSFNPTSGGGTATVGAVTLTSTPQPFTADANGDVTVTYTVPASPPATGSDVLTAQNALSSTFSSTDGYAFG